MKIAMPAACPVQEKFLAARRELSAALIERDDEIDLVLTALVAQEHVLLVGPPGCAKSLLLDAVMGWMRGRKFTILLTKFSTPEELFGPISVAGLKEDRYRRITAGKLPEADGCFIDEVWKASSAILNTLLRLLNERVFDAGDGGLAPVPLRLCVAASNEWPQQSEGGRELNALFDRFLLRRSVRPILSAAGRQRLLWERDHTPKLSTSITPAEIDQAHADAAALPWADEAKEALEAVLRELAKEGVQPGDRRKFKAVGAAQAFAYLNGSDHVEPEHLEVLAHVLWESPEEQPDKAAGVVARVASPTGMRVNSLLMEVEQILAATDVKQLAQAATAAGKLQEVHKKLSGLKGGDGRVAKAREYVQQQVKRIKLASIEAL
ncbi:MAG TPA: AAA family ATPase [Gemmataceae bacterium]|nr:AAA family ATPase [Gemmataceae bacterium]